MNIKKAKTEKPESRRNFMSKSFFASAGLIIGAGEELLKGKPEKIKMLTADGKLVQIDKSLVPKSITKKIVSNKEILDWMENEKSINKD